MARSPPSPSPESPADAKGEPKVVADLPRDPGGDHLLARRKAQKFVSHALRAPIAVDKSQPVRGVSRREVEAGNPFDEEVVQHGRVGTFGRGTRVGVDRVQGASPTGGGGIVGGAGEGSDIAETGQAIHGSEFPGRGQKLGYKVRG